MKKLFSLFASSLLAFVTLSAFVPTVVYAANDCPDAKDRNAFELIPTWYKYLDLDSDCEVSDFQFPGDIWKIGIAGIEIILRIAGLVAFGMITFAGFKFVLSRGNPTEASKARQTIIDAAIGIAITSIATVLVGFLGRTLS